MKICLGNALVNLAGVSSSRRLCWQILLDEYCLEIAGSDGIQSCAPMFRECGEALLSVTIMEHILRSMVKSEVEIGMKAEFLRTDIRGSSLCSDEELAS
jgi:hypothetical protein